MSRYRWIILAVGTTAQTCFAALPLGVAVMLPALRTQYELTLSDAGLLLAAVNVGTMVGMLPWGLAADRFGERVVVASGLSISAAALLVAPLADTFATLTPVLLLGSFGGASVSAASGRAIMYWFGRGERGLALGIRQTSPPLAGAATALALPHIVDAGGVSWGFITLGLACLVGAGVAALFLREAPEGQDAPTADPRVLREPRLWILTCGSALLVLPQFAFFSYVVLFFHDERGFSPAAAGGVFAALQVCAAAARITVGRWSDLHGSRLAPLRRIAIGSAILAVVVGLLVDGPLVVIIPLVIVAGAIAGSGNGAALAAAAELAGRRRSGAALGMQQTAHSISAVVIAPAFALAVTVGGWNWAFGLLAIGPVGGFLVLRQLRDEAPSPL
jgi:sugar phosphate permease